MLPRDSSRLELTATVGAATQVLLRDGDILVVAQKVISKAEGQQRNLNAVSPNENAVRYANRCRKDPRLAEIILSESIEVLRCAPDVLIVRHRLGFICANAAVDASDVENQNSHGKDKTAVLLPPSDPEASAEALRITLGQETSLPPGVIINDSFGRAWRLGTIGTAIGSTGISSLENLRGDEDLFGRPLFSTEIPTADQLAAAASSLQGQVDEGTSVILIRGSSCNSPNRPASSLLRPTAQDLFR